MKTLFALLGLFMFASVSSTDLTTERNDKTQQSNLSLESGGNQVGGNKKDSALIGLALESGGNQVGGNKKDSALIG